MNPNQLRCPDGASRGLLTAAATLIFFLLFLSRMCGELAYVWCVAAALGGLFLWDRYRLAATEVELREDGLRVSRGGKSWDLEWANLQRVRFSSYPFDLVLEGHEVEVRVPRTIQGFQRLLECALKAVGERFDSPELTVQVHRIRRAMGCGLIAFFLTAALYMLLLDPSAFFCRVFAITFLLSALVLLDQLILRRYRFTAEGLTVRTLFGVRRYASQDLRAAYVKKELITSVIVLEFQDQDKARRVLIEDRVVNVPVQRIAILVERAWGKAVTGAAPAAAQPAEA
jgi:hypothetical protein